MTFPASFDGEAKPAQRSVGLFAARVFFRGRFFLCSICSGECIDVFGRVVTALINQAEFRGLTIGGNSFAVDKIERVEDVVFCDLWQGHGGSFRAILQRIVRHAKHFESQSKYARGAIWLQSGAAVLRLKVRGAADAETGKQGDQFPRPPEPPRTPPAPPTLPPAAPPPRLPTLPAPGAGAEGADTETGALGV